tara:strand:+ start:476 stop:1759 length:1284 start_codon:yes stop_codon:yes gene_type:complete
MRYLALTKLEREQMIKDTGISHVDELYAAAPKEFILTKKIDELPDHKGEIEVETHLRELSEKNKPASSMPFFLGAGCYYHHVPAAVDHLIQRSEFLTAYTPYQPEISQGTLKTIFQFQTIIARLTGMEVSNASLYDGATGLVEAVLMAVRIKKNKRKVAILGDLNPDYLAVLKTYTDLAEIELISKNEIDKNTAAVITAYPDFYGNTLNLEKVRVQADEVEALMIVVVTEILSLGLMEAPKMADIVTGEAASIGVGMNFGGPHLGFFACKKQYVRQIPGRICGATVDEDNKESFVLTLNAREQHIRREKATSNICSNQGLCAVAFTIHSFLLGEIGFKDLALLNHQKACKLADILAKIRGVEVTNDSFFNEFTIKLSKDAKEVNQKLLERGVIGGLALDNNLMVIAVTELTSEKDMEILAKHLKEIL